MEFNLMPDFNKKNLKVHKLKSEILQTNETSVEYGLVLTDNDAEMLIQEGEESIKVQDRIEFGKSATIKIIDKFMKSTYILQSNYADTIAGLIEVFYEVKEESLDILTDDEVIDIMFDFFEKESGGSVEVLQTRDMDYLCKKIRNSAQGIYDDDDFE